MGQKVQFWRFTVPFFRTTVGSTIPSLTSRIVQPYRHNSFPAPHFFPQQLWTPSPALIESNNFLANSKMFKQASAPKSSKPSQVGPTTCQSCGFHRKPFQMTAGPAFLMASTPPSVTLCPAVRVADLRSFPSKTPRPHQFPHSCWDL